MTSPAEDPFTELVDARIPRVDLVDKAANGMTFLIAKGQDGSGLMDPDTVRDLIGKTDPAPQSTDQQEQVTMSGSPAAIAKLIHQAAVKHTRSESIPAEEVAKEALVDAPTGSESDLDPTTVLATPDDGPQQTPGSEVEPGSPAWEAIDAATARKWTSILARAKTAVTVLSEREMLEAASADPNDAFNAMDLDDAAGAIDYAISVLAPFAVDEQTEADCAADAMTAVGKALTDFDPASLDTIEALAHVTKAGQTLSGRTEQAIRDAVASLQKALSSLPTADPDSLEGGLPVAKEETVMPEASAGETPATDAPDTVGKADQTPQIAVYDRHGKLVGIVAPDKLTPVADSGSEDEPAKEIEPESAADEPSDTPDTPTDLAPAPGGEVGTPADEIGKATEGAPTAAAETDTEAVPAAEVGKAAEDAPTATVETDTKTDTSSTTDDVLKSSIAEVVKAALDEHSATQTEAIAKQAQALEGLAEVVETLKGQIHTLEEQPAAPRVFTNGAVPPAHQLRGQDRGAPAVNTAQAMELKKSLYGAADAGEQNRIAQGMQATAIDALQAIHQRRA
jgi:flagellar hook-basal body complex protein FliE